MAGRFSGRPFQPPGGPAAPSPLARKRAGEIKKRVKQGVDPKAAADAEKAAVQAGAQTFGAIAEKYIKRECSGLRHGWEVERIIRRELMPSWPT